MTQADGGALLVDLLYERDASVDDRRLLAEVNKVLPQTVLSGNGRPPTLLVHEGHGATGAGGSPEPVMSVLMPAAGGGQLGARGRIDLSQTWEFPQAQRALQRCRAALTIGEVFGHRRPRSERLTIFRATVLAVCRLTEPAAAWWPTAAQLLPPPSPAGPPLMGLLNVRLFRVAGSNRDVLMDTLGLHVFGLPDLQCHCHGVELPQLARYLRNAAAYVFSSGDVIRDRDTITGLGPGERWQCRHREALVPPERPVIDLHPGAGHAAETDPLTAYTPALPCSGISETVISQRAVG
jgi:Domain of unknown function (DUF4261)